MDTTTLTRPVLLFNKKKQLVQCVEIEARALHPAMILYGRRAFVYQGEDIYREVDVLIVPAKGNTWEEAE